MAEQNFPSNIAKAIGITGEMPKDFLGTLYYLSSELDERKFDILFRYYRDGMTMQDIGDVYGISRSRIQQIIEASLIALRKQKPMLEVGISLYYTALQNEAVQKASQIAYNKACEHITNHVAQTIQDASKEIGKAISLDDEIKKLDLSVRSYNALIRSGVHTVTDIILLGKDGLAGLRNLGSKSYDEIVDKLVYAYGEREDDWR